MASQYKTIAGVKYERGLLELAEAEVQRGGGCLLKAAAVKLWEDAMDGGRVTATEQRTLRHILSVHKVRKDAKDFLELKLKAQAELTTGPTTKATATSQYYTHIAGMRFDRALLEQAEGFAKLGLIRLEQAAQLWANAHDGKGVTAVERQTLEYALKTLPFKSDARQLLARLVLEGGAALPVPTQRGALTGMSSEASCQELMLSSEGEGSRPWWSAVIPNTLAKIQNWLAPGSKKRLKDDDAEEEFEQRPVKVRKDGAATVSHELAVVAARPPVCPATAESLRPELRQLLVEQGFLASDTSALAALEWPGAAAEADQARQRAKAAAEVDRILASRTAQEILGGGSREEQQKEFKRIALLLHPDKGIVQTDDDRASLAMRLALAAAQKIRRT